MPFAVYFINVVEELKYHLGICSAKYIFTTPGVASQAVNVARSLNSQVYRNALRYAAF